MTDATLSLIVLAGTIVLFVSNRLSVGLVAIICALSLYVTGLVDASTAVAGFGEPIVVFIAGLFIVSEGLDASGVTGWAGQALVRQVGTGRARLLLGLTALAALLGAFITPNGAAAALLPVTVVAARRAGLLPAQLLMPVAFAASAGALLVLSGSTVNVIVSDALVDLTGSGFGFFEFGLIGLPLVLVTLAVCLLAGGRLLPHREPEVATADLSGHIDQLVEQYSLRRGFYRLRTPAEGALVGRPADAVVVGPDMTVLGVQRPDGEQRSTADPLDAGDTLSVTGDADAVDRLVTEHGLEVVATPLVDVTATDLLSSERGVAEVVVPPRSRLVGESVYPGLVRSGLTLLTVARAGSSRGARSTVLQPGDMLLLNGDWSAVGQLVRESDVVLLNDPDLVRRQNAPLGGRAWLALAVLAVTVVLLAIGISPAISALTGAGLMVATRVITPYQAYHAVSWQTVVLVGGLIPLSVALTDSGAADQIAGLIVRAVAGGSPLLLLSLLFLLTVALGQVISNTATVLIIVPIALAAASAAGVAPAPVLMLVAVAGAASFLTPIATAANMIVMGAAGYRFGDYLKLGLVLTLAWFVVAIVLIPLIWRT